MLLSPPTNVCILLFLRLSNSSFICSAEASDGRRVIRCSKPEKYDYYNLPPAEREAKKERAKCRLERRSIQQEGSKEAATHDKPDIMQVIAGVNAAATSAARSALDAQRHLTRRTSIPSTAAHEPVSPNRDQSDGSSHLEESAG